MLIIFAHDIVGTMSFSSAGLSTSNAVSDVVHISNRFDAHIHCLTLIIIIKTYQISKVGNDLLSVDGACSVKQT